MSAIAGRDRVAGRSDWIRDRPGMASLGRRRGWLMRRLLLAADLVGLFVAYVSRCNSPLRRRQPTGSGLVGRSSSSSRAFRSGFCYPYPRALRPRRGACRSLDGRRHGRCLPGPHPRHVVVPGLHERRRCAAPQSRRGSSCSGSLRSPSSRSCGREPAVGRRQAAYMQNVIIVGSGEVAQLLAEKIEKQPEYGLHVVGFVDRNDRSSTTNGKKPLIGTTEDIRGSSRSTTSSVSSSLSRPSRTSRRWR